MPADTPDGLAIEQIWVVEADYSADAAERRVAVRTEHLTRSAELRAAGKIVELGGFMDMSGSLLLLRVPTAEEALAIVKADIYFRSGVWTGFRVRARGRLVRTDEITGR